MHPILAPVSPMRSATPVLVSGTIEIDPTRIVISAVAGLPTATATGKALEGLGEAQKLEYGERLRVEINVMSPDEG